MQHDVECSVNVQVIAQWLRYSSRLCASTRSVSLKVTLIGGSVSHHTVSVLDSHFPPLFQLRVLK